MSQRGLGWKLRWVSCLVGILSAALTLYIFYFHRQLKWTTPWDAWLIATAPQMRWKTWLPVFLAIGALALAWRRLPLMWRTEVPPPLDFAAGWRTWRQAPRRVTSQLVPAVFVVAVLAGVGLIGYQAWLVVMGKVPTVPVWLTGMGMLLVAGALFDSLRPEDWGRTVADALIALGMLGTVLGVAGAVGGQLPALLILAVGAALFAVGIRLAARRGSAVAAWEHCLVLGLTLLTMCFALSRVWSWRWAFIGDEWRFYWEASRMLHHLPKDFRVLGLLCPGDFLNENFAHAVMMGGMRLGGENLYGWRLSSMLPHILSIAPIYYFVRWLAGREAAWLGAGLVASSHVLLNFSLIGYNNTHALLPLALSLGGFAFAAQRRSMTRYLLLGLAMGTALLVYGLARLTAIPMTFLLFAFMGSFRRRDFSRWLCVVGGGLASSTPLLFSLNNWKALLYTTTPAGHPEGNVPLRMALNAVYALRAFLTGTVEGHFIAGPYVDAVTEFLILCGLGCLLGGAWYFRRARIWLLAGVTFVAAVGAHQHYGFVSNTRTFIVIVAYAISAALGGAALARFLCPRRNSAYIALMGLLAVAGIGGNALHLELIPWVGRGSIAHILQQMQETAAADHGGLPALVVMNNGRGTFRGIYAPYGVGMERLILLSPDEALAVPQFCAMADQPAMALVVGDVSGAAAICQRIEQCWPGCEKTKLTYSVVGDPCLYRFVTKSGQAELSRPAAERHSWHQHPSQIMMPQGTEISQVAVAEPGTIYALSKERQQVLRFSPEGRLEGSFAVQLSEPGAMALTPDGLLLVAGEWQHPLTWYDAAGTVVRQAAAAPAHGKLGHLAIRPNGEVLVPFMDANLVLCFSPAGQCIGTFHAGGRMKRPVAVAAEADGSFWVLEAGDRLLHLSATDQTLLDTPVLSRLEGPLLLTAGGDLIVSDPENYRVIRLNRQGQLAGIWANAFQASAITRDPQGRLLVVTWGHDRVLVFPALPDGPTALPVSFMSR